MIQLSEEEYLAMRGVVLPTSSHFSDQARFPHGETAQQKAKRLAGYKAAEAAYAEKRRKVREEYQKLVAQGDVIPKNN